MSPDDAPEHLTTLIIETACNSRELRSTYRDIDLIFYDSPALTTPEHKSALSAMIELSPTK